MAEPRIPIPRNDIAAFCERWRITQLALFGSVLRDDFRSESDVDVLVRFSPDARHKFHHLDEMEDELTEIFGRKADLVDWVAVENSRNPYRRRPILESAQVIYDAA